MEWKKLSEMPVGGSHTWYNFQPWAFAEAYQHHLQSASLGRRYLRLWSAWHNDNTHGVPNLMPWTVDGQRNTLYFNQLRYVLDKVGEDEGLVSVMAFQHHDFPLATCRYRQWVPGGVEHRYDRVWQFQKDCLDWHIDVLQEYPHAALEFGNEIPLEFNESVGAYVDGRCFTLANVPAGQASVGTLRSRSGCDLPFLSDGAFGVTGAGLFGYDTDHDGSALQARSGNAIADKFTTAAEVGAAVIIQMHPVSLRLRLRGWYGKAWNDPNNEAILRGEARLKELLGLGVDTSPVTTGGPARTKAFIELIRWLNNQMKRGVSNADIMVDPRFQSRWDKVWR